MYDIILKNGLIADGSGKQAFAGDIGIHNGIVVKIGNSLEGAGEIIDCQGLIIAPGFIDAHTHSDRSGVFPSDAYNYLEQGVTTQVAGQCGSSPVPYGDEDGPIFDEALTTEENEFAKNACKSPRTFMENANKLNMGTNMAFLLGHGAVRKRVMGYSDALPTEKQLEEMQDIVREAVNSGYLGYSSGLVYAPSVYARTDELIKLAKAMPGCLYASHIRSEGDNCREAVAEAIRVGEESGVAVIISHLKVCGKINEGKSEVILKMIDDANSRGVKVYADQYPFTAGSAPLSAQIPPKYHVGGKAMFLKRLGDKEERKRIERDIFNEYEIFESSIYSAGFEGTLVVGSPRNQYYAGKTITQIAEELNKTCIDAYCDLLLENDGQGQGIYFSQNESDMLRIIAHPRIIGGSDWSDINIRHDEERPGGCHPRGMSAAVKRLEIIRDKKLMPMESAVRSVTGLAALALGLEGHGIIKEGNPANITVLDYAKLKANADYMHPFRRNEGIKTVIVNGQVVVREGRALGVKAGRLIKRAGVK